MSALGARLRKLEKDRVCRIHRVPLECPRCEWTGELTPNESAELDRLLIWLGVITPEGELRVPAHELRVAGECRRCGAELYCVECQAPGAEARYAEAYAGLSSAEQANLERLMRKLSPSSKWD